MKGVGEDLKMPMINLENNLMDVYTRQKILLCKKIFHAPADYQG